MSGWSEELQKPQDLITFFHLKFNSINIIEELYTQNINSLHNFNFPPHFSESWEEIFHAFISSIRSRSAAKQNWNASCSTALCTLEICAFFLSTLSTVLFSGNGKFFFLRNTPQCVGGKIYFGKLTHWKWIHWESGKKVKCVLNIMRKRKSKLL